jgi:putative transposase
VKLKSNLETTETNVLKLFIDGNGKYCFWQDTNAPKKIENPDFYRQKLNYIHENPVRKSYVARPEYWVWSSANPASPLAIRLFGT